MKVRLSILVAIAALPLIGALPGYAAPAQGIVTPARLAQPVPNSTYTGTIAGGGTVDFDVSPDGKTVTRFRAADVPGRPISGTCTYTGVATGSLPIINNAFEASGIGSITTFAFSGTFPASQQATGTVKVNNLQCRTDTLTWTASTTTPMPPATQSITFPTPPDTPVNAGPVTLAAAASSGLPVSYTSDTPSVCTVSGVQAQLKAVGTCSITARQPGDASYLAAPAVQRSFSVLPKPKATVKVRARAGRGKLFVDVNPNLTTGERWTFRVQAMKRSGKWRTLSKTYTTQGEKQTRILNRGEGVYRVKVKPDYGFAGTTSRAVSLQK